MELVDFLTAFSGKPRKINWRTVPFLSHLSVADIGPGIGTTFFDLAHQRPDLSLLAVEPDKDIAFYLVKCLKTNPTLSKRVTVLDRAVQATHMPLLGGAVLMGVMYFLPAETRVHVWQKLANSLAVGAPVVYDARDVLMRDLQARRLIQTKEYKQLLLQRWFTQQPAPDGSTHLTNEYLALAADEVVAKYVTQHVVWSLALEQARGEAKAAGFQVVEVPDQAQYSLLVKQ